MTLTPAQIALIKLVLTARLEGYEESFERNPDGSFSLRLRRAASADVETVGQELPEAA